MFNKTFIAALMAASAMATSKDYSSNGANWGQTDPLCDEGKEQSPINLTVDKTSTSKDMEINGFGYKDYTLPKADVAIHGATNVAAGEYHLNFADGSMSVFRPLQFHFHAPSEHTIEGNFFDLELHVVHLYAEDNGLGAVIGFMFDRVAGGNYDNDFLDAFIDDS